MKIWDIIPFRTDKNLGKAYNETMQEIPSGDWCCLRDADTMFLTPDYGNILHEYALKNPDAALLTCFTNRVSALSRMQLLHGVIDMNTDIRRHIGQADKQKKHLYKTTPINGTISGMLMLMSRAAWAKNPFNESGACLGVDTAYSRMLTEQGISILRMDGLYVWHSYRIANGIHNKAHLQIPMLKSN